MARCTNCDYKWHTKEILKLGFSKEGKDCSHCGKQQYFSAETKQKLTLGYLSLIFLVIFPFVITLSDKDEPLW